LCAASGGGAVATPSPLARSPSPLALSSRPLSLSPSRPFKWVAPPPINAHTATLPAPSANPLASTAGHVDARQRRLVAAAVAGAPPRRQRGCWRCGFGGGDGGGATPAPVRVAAAQCTAAARGSRGVSPPAARRRPPLPARGWRTGWAIGRRRRRWWADGRRGRRRRRRPRWPHARRQPATRDGGASAAAGLAAAWREGWVVDASGRSGRCHEPRRRG